MAKGADAQLVSGRPTTTFVAIGASGRRWDLTSIVGMLRRRTSIWCRTDTGWRQLFHPGTPIPWMPCSSPGLMRSGARTLAMRLLAWPTAALL